MQFNWWFVNEHAFAEMCPEWEINVVVKKQWTKYHVRNMIIVNQ